MPFLASHCKDVRASSRRCEDPISQIYSRLFFTMYDLSSDEDNKI
jgi:hypothetical protein